MININLNQFKAVIFDMDGTMVDNNDYHKKSWFEFCKRHNIEMNDDIFREKLSGRKNKESLKALFNREPAEDEVKKYGDEKEEIYRNLYAPDIKEVEGLTSLIEEIKKLGLKVAIATTASKENRKFVLESLKLDGFDAILGEEDTTKGKPDPEIYTNTAKSLNLAPADCLVFEDSPSGVKSAKTAGMKVVGLLTSHSEEELKEAGYMIHNFTEIQLV